MSTISTSPTQAHERTRSLNEGFALFARLIVSLLSVATLASRAAAQQPSHDVVTGCQTAAANRMHVSRPEADSIEFEPNPAVSSKPDSATGVTGAGRFFDNARRAWRPFSYDCTYDASIGKGEGHVRADSLARRR
jgi:hypothetical protein